VRGRIADYLEHFARRGLLFQRFGQIVGALAQFVEQPRVLDGDDGLRREVFYKLNLLVGKWPNFPPIQIDASDKLAFLDHWHQYKGPNAGGFDQGHDPTNFFEIGLITAEVVYVDYSFCRGETT